MALLRHILQKKMVMNENTIRNKPLAKQMTLVIHCLYQNLHSKLRESNVKYEKLHSKFRQSNIEYSTASFVT